MIRILDYAIAIALIITLLMAYKVGNEEKKLYEQCNYKVLCEYGKLDSVICTEYRKMNKNISINFTMP